METKDEIIEEIKKTISPAADSLTKVQNIVYALTIINPIIIIAIGIIGLFGFWILEFAWLFLAAAINILDGVILHEILNVIIFRFREKNYLTNKK